MSEFLARKRFTLNLEFIVEMQKLTNEKIEEVRLNCSNADELAQADWWKERERLNKALYGIIQNDRGLINRLLRTEITNVLGSISTVGYESEADYSWLDDLNPSDDFDAIIKSLMPRLRSEDEKLVRDAIMNEILSDNLEPLLALIKPRLINASIQEFPLQTDMNLERTSQ